MLNTYVNGFAAEMNNSGKSNNTISTYTRNAQLFVDWLEGVTAEQFNGKINALDISEYTRYLSDTLKQSLNSIKAKLTAVQKFAEYLTSGGYMPAVKVQQKKGTTEPNVEVLEKNELYKFLRFQTILNTGIRESELCALELSDLEITERKGTATIRSGKGNKYRIVPLNKDARNALTNYIEHARPATDSEKVFIGQRGALTRNGVYKIVSRLGEKAIGKKVFPHMLRHQCFTTMAKNPAVDLKTRKAKRG